MSSERERARNIHMLEALAVGPLFFERREHRERVEWLVGIGAATYSMEAKKVEYTSRGRMLTTERRYSITPKGIEHIKQWKKEGKS